MWSRDRFVKRVPLSFVMPSSHLCIKPPRMSQNIVTLGIWGDTWLTRGKYGIYVAVTGSMWCLLPHKISPIYCCVSYVAVTRIPSLVLHNTWHYVIIRYSYGELPKFVLRCSYEAALRKGVTAALRTISQHSFTSICHTTVTNQMTRCKFFLEIYILNIFYW